MWFSNMSDTNRAETRDWKFLISKVGALYYLCSENKGTDPSTDSFSGNVIVWRVSRQNEFLITDLSF